MKKILFIVIGLCISNAYADDNLSQSKIKTQTPSSLSVGNIQSYKEYLATYVEGLLTASCEQALKGRTENAVIDTATQGMKKDTENYYAIHNTVVLGTAFGDALKEKGTFITKDKTRIDSCAGGATYIMMHKEFMEIFVDGFDSSKQQASEQAVPKDSVYRTTSKALKTLYSENEVAADEKIGSRKVEVTGLVKDIRKDFTDDVVILLQSGNNFMPVRLSMEESERAKASKLKKGQETKITCAKMMFLISSPAGSECKFN